MKTTSASTAKPVKPRVPIVQFKATSDFRKHAFQEFYRREFLKVDNFCVKETKAARTQLSNIMVQIVDVYFYRCVLTHDCYLV